MNFFSQMRLRVEKDTIVRITRRLKGKGIIGVSPGQEVIPSDIIGNGHILSGFRTFKLAEMLGVAPSQIEKYLTRQIGTRIYEGEILASKKGWLFGDKKVVVSPSDGILDFLNPKTGEIRLTLFPKEAALPAGVYGIVEAVDKERGQVMIRTQVSSVYGILGSGMVRDGILHTICKRDELVIKSLISPKLDGQILIGGSLIFRDAITSAISGGVSGIITGGINARDYKGMAGGRLIFPKKLANDIGISVIVCEGFGSIPIGEDIYSILGQFDGRFVSIDGNKGIINLPSFDPDSIIKVRKTGLKPPQYMGSIAESDILPQIEVKVGLRARIIGNSYAGEQGKIIAIDQTQTVLPSKVKTFMAIIETRHRKIQAPVANIEVIL